MAITSNGWEDFWDDLKDTVKGVFADNQDEIIENADENPVDVLPLSPEDETIVLESYNKAVDDTIEKTVDDINDEFGGDTNDVPESQTTFAKLIGGFFIVTALKRAYERLHGATVARQTEDDRKEAQDKAVNTGNNQIDVVTRNEIGQTYSDSARAQFEARGQDSFTWIHSGADHPRQDHLAVNGQVFTVADGAPVEGTFPGVAFNCACYMADANQIQNFKRREIMNKKIFNLAVDNGVAELWINGVIGDYDIWNDSGMVFSEFKWQFEEATKSQKVKIFINSEGGYVFDAIAMYNLIKMSDADIETHVVGLAASAASFIPLAVESDKRYVHQGSTGMIHNPWMCACGGKADFNKAADELDIVADSIARIYADRTNLSIDQARSLMDAETYFSDVELQEHGFANLVDDKVESSKSTILDFVAEIKKCSVEQKQSMKDLINYSEPNKGDDMSKEMQEQLEKLESKVANLESSKTEDDGKIEVLESRIAELEEQNATLTTERDEARASIDSAEKGALETVKKDMAEATDAKALAAKSGFEDLEGDTASVVKRNCLKAANVSNPDKFDGEQLNSMFDFVLNTRKSDSEHDEAFDKGKPDNTVTEFQRPTPNRGAA